MKKLYLRVLSQSSIYSLGNLSQNALSIVLLPLYTSYLSLVDYGILALLDLTILLITRVIVTPVISAFSRFYYKPEYLDQNETLLFNLFLVLTTKTIFLSLLYWYLSTLINRLLFNDPQLLYIVQVYALILFLQPISEFLLQLVRMKEMAKYYVFLSLSKFVLVTGLIIYLLTGLELGILAVIYGNIFGLALLALLCIPVLLKNSVFKVSLSAVKEPLKYGYPMILGGYSSILNESGDKYLLNMLASVSSVGLYSFGYKIAGMLNLVLIVPLKQSIYPIIFKKEHDPQQQKEIIANVATYYYLIGIFMALGLSLLAKETIMLLAGRPEFWAAWTIVPLISLAYIQHGLGNFVIWGPVLRNKSLQISGMIFASTIVNVGLNFILIPAWDVLGAAFATLLTFLFLNAMYTYYSARFYDLHFDWKRLGYIAFVGVALFLVSLFMANTNSLVFNIALKFVILLLYPFVFLITPGFFTLREKVYLRQVWRKRSKIYALPVR